MLILSIDGGLAYLGMSGEFEYRICADHLGYPQHRQMSAYLEMSLEFE